MTKDDFKRSIKAFLVDVDWDDYKDRWLDNMLTKLEPKPQIIKETKLEPKPQIIKETKKIVVERRVMVNQDFRLKIIEEPGLKKSLLQVAKEVKRETGFSLFMLRSKNRDAGLVKARKLFIRKAMLESVASLKEIGRYIDRDHTTIMYHRDEMVAKTRKRRVK
jgi:hypothetical protein